MRTGSRWAVGGAATVLLALGCGPVETSDPGVLLGDALLLVDPPILAAAPFPDDRIVVAGDPPGAPEGCGIREIVRRVQALFDEINTGRDGIGIRNFVGPASNPPLMWYHVEGPDRAKGVSARSIEEIDRGLREGQQHAEHLTLEALQINRWTHGLAHLGPVVVTRTADDLPPGEHSLVGKAAFRCSDGRFVVLGLADAPIAAGRE